MIQPNTSGLQGTPRGDIGVIKCGYTLQEGDGIIVSALSGGQFDLNDVASMLVIDCGGPNSRLSHKIFSDPGELCSQGGHRPRPSEIKSQCFVGRVVFVSFQRIDGHQPCAGVVEAALLGGLNSSPDGVGQGQIRIATVHEVSCDVRPSTGTHVRTSQGICEGVLGRHADRARGGVPRTGTDFVCENIVFGAVDCRVASAIMNEGKPVSTGLSVIARGA